jgi:hypothetical protein
MKKIFLAASMSFYKELIKVEKQLEERGFTVHIPISAGIMKEKNDFDVSHFKGFQTEQTDEKRAQFIRTNFENIADSDCILVINGEKNGIKGYIGPNVLMEIGLAFYLKKKIYIWNPIEETAPYEEELRIFNVTIINKDLEQIESIT